MNAYKSYLKREKQRKSREFVDSECSRYIEHMDLCMLMVLHEEFGFGAVRLERAYRALVEKFEWYKRYMADGDRTAFNTVNSSGDPVKRDDELEIKDDLAKIGFDYDALVAQIEAEIVLENQEEKG